MKKIFFILLIPVFSNAQQLSPIWKLNWGMRYDSAINFIKATRNVIPVSVKGDTAIMVTVEYRDQLFDGHQAFSSNLYFIGNKLLRSEIFFVNYPKDDNKIFRLFDSIKTTLTLKYFEPQHCENAKTYVDNEKMKAIKEKLTNYYCNWFFPKDNDSEKGGRLNLQISDQGNVVLIYDYSKAYNILNSDF